MDFEDILAAILDVVDIERGIPDPWEDPKPETEHAAVALARTLAALVDP